MNKKTEFAYWIERMGDSEAAKMLRRKPRTVAAWRRMERFPAARTCHILARKTGCSLHGCNPQIFPKGI